MNNYDQRSDFEYILFKISNLIYVYDKNNKCVHTSSNLRLFSTKLFTKT